MQGNDTLFIGCVYRSPNSAPDMNNRLLNEIKEISNLRPTHLLLMGDFNFPEIEWSDLSCQLTSGIRKTADFIACIHDAFLFQHVDEATRFRHGVTPTCDDLIFTNEPNMIDRINYDCALGKSDHIVLTFNYICYLPKTQREYTKYLYDRGDYDEFRKILNLD